MCILERLLQLLRLFCLVIKTVSYCFWMSRKKTFKAISAGPVLTFILQNLICKLCVSYMKLSAQARNRVLISQTWSLITMSPMISPMRRCSVTRVSYSYLRRELLSVALTGAFIDQALCPRWGYVCCANNVVEKILLEQKLLIILCCYNTQKVVLFCFVSAI